MSSEVTLRRLIESDLALVEAWLHEPHVARWWLVATTVEQELAAIREYLAGAPFEVLMAELDGRPVGWCQWYRWWDDPPEAAELGVGVDDIGIDYGIGPPDATGHGVGTAMIGALVAHVRTAVPDATIVVEPDAENTASRRVLEKNGFVLQEVRALSFEPEDRNAIYRSSSPISSSLSASEPSSPSTSPTTSRATAYASPGE